jgi:hypothetical protein
MKTWKLIKSTEQEQAWSRTSNMSHCPCEKPPMYLLGNNKNKLLPRRWNYSTKKEYGNNS